MKIFLSYSNMGKRNYIINTIHAPLKKTKKLLTHTRSHTQQPPYILSLVGISPLNQLVLNPFWWGPNTYNNLHTHTLPLSLFIRNPAMIKNKRF